MLYYCDNCKKFWMYAIEKCIFCGGTISQKEETKYHVIGYSEVFVSSTGNERVPYYVNLIEDENGQKIIRKSFNKYQIGDFFSFERNVHQSIIIGVIGTGLLGIQIAAYMLQFGYPTILKTREKKTKETSVQKIRKILSKQSEEDEVNQIIEQLSVTTEYQDLKSCDIIIEAVAEEIDIKKDVFRELSKICPDTAIFATNSSSLSIDEIADGIPCPERCIGMHFFNPVNRMDLVEVVIGEKTSSVTQQKIMAFASNLNKKPIVVKNSPGYIVNRLLLPQINEAIHLLEEGVASKQDIDSAVKLGLNHPMGPFELADFIGIDICNNILEIMHHNFDNPKYKPASLLQSMVAEGKLGFKSGDGFYHYGGKRK
jgi:3-hydroxybutyryl-CoA dehydrogenase